MCPTVYNKVGEDSSTFLTNSQIYLIAPASLVAP